VILGDNDAMNTSTGLLICGHGSRDPQAQVLFCAWAAKLQQRTAFVHWEVGFMEIARPTIADAARALVAKGLEHIVVIPGFIMGAAHTLEDIPAILRELKNDSLFENVQIDYAHRIANHPLLLQAAAARIKESLGSTNADLARSHLLVVAHGSSDIKANHDILRLTEKLQQQLNIGSATAAFSNVCSPRVEEALAQLDTKRIQRLIVLPYFLLPSYPVRQLYLLADQFAVQHPGLQVLKARCLDDHSSTLDAFVDVLQKTLTDSPP
jgi:sirohydrochlorin ferrochelatase